MNTEDRPPIGAPSGQAEEEAPAKKPVGDQKSLRTLEGDIAEAIEERNASAASIAIAARDGERGAAESKSEGPSGAGKKTAIALGSVVLVALGLAAAYYLYLKSPVAPQAAAPAQQSASIPSVVSPDAQESVDLSGLNQTGIAAALQKAFAGATGGSIVQIVPVERSAAGTPSIMDFNDFLEMAGISAPDILTRSITGWMLGVYDDDGKPAPFMALSNDFFQNAYAGMIAWEKTIPDDLAPLFGYSPAGAGEATGTLASYFGIQGDFTDGVIENKDVRLFTEPDGSVVLLYSFVDNDTIVITTDENALAAIIARLENQDFIR